MSKKIDIREIHTNFEHLLFERDALISSDLTSSKIVRNISSDINGKNPLRRADKTGSVKASWQRTLV